MAATDVRQVGINFGGQDYFDSFPKLEKRGRIPKREKPKWTSTGTGETAAAEEQQEKLGVVVEQQILVEDHCPESTDIEEKTQETAVADQEERETPHEEHHKSNDEEREIEEKELGNVGFDEHHKSDEAPQEEKEWVVSATQEYVENPQKFVEEENPAEERETSTDEEDEPADYLFFGRFRTLIRRPKIARQTAGNQEEREAPVEEEPSESNDRTQEREIIKENKLEDVGVDEQQKSDDAQITTSNQESTQQEKEGVVSQLPNYVKNPHKPTTDVEEAEEKEISENEAQKSTTDVEEKEGGARESEAEEKETSDESIDERETTEPEVVAGGERENHDSAALAVIRQEEKRVQQIVAEDVREEEISFGGKNYDEHFPKIERKERITKRERRGEFQK